jgi:hypothetical protein
MMHTAIPDPPGLLPLTGKDRELWDVIAHKMARRGVLNPCTVVGLECWTHVYATYRRLHREWRAYVGRGIDTSEVVHEVEAWRRLCREYAADGWIPLTHMTVMSDDGFDADLRRWFEERGVNDRCGRERMSE